MTLFARLTSVTFGGFIDVIAIISAVDVDFSAGLDAVGAGCAKVIIIISHEAVASRTIRIFGAFLHAVTVLVVIETGADMCTWAWVGFCIACFGLFGLLGRIACFAAFAEFTAVGAVTGGGKNGVGI